MIAGVDGGGGKTTLDGGGEVSKEEGGGVEGGFGVITGAFGVGSPPTSGKPSSSLSSSSGAENTLELGKTKGIPAPGACCLGFGTVSIAGGFGMMILATGVAPVLLVALLLVPCSSLNKGLPWLVSGVGGTIDGVCGGWGL